MQDTIDKLADALHKAKFHEIADKETAAKKLHEIICKFSAEEGQNPAIETRLLTPYESLQSETGDNWRVIWEAGPYKWAITVSHIVHNMKSGEGWYTEPYYSFDLCFTN